MSPSLRIAFFGSSLTSEFWNASAGYFRGIMHALAERGHDITSYEPEPFDGRSNQDIPNPDWARIVAYRADSSWAATRAIEQARGCDVVIKVSGVGACDEVLESAVLQLKSPRTSVLFWDVDAASTLDRLTANLTDPFRLCLPRFDSILTLGGGASIAAAYESFGARQCVPIHHGFDPRVHFAARPDFRFTGTLGFVGNSLPDRDGRVDQFFSQAAALLPTCRFVLGGKGWEKSALPRNVVYCGHVASHDLNAFNTSPSAILSVSRESTLRHGYSPPTRLFEAAAAGACIISDEWPGLAEFLEPGVEVLTAANASDVAAHVEYLEAGRARKMGEAARERVISAHTYAHRALQLEALLDGRQLHAPIPLSAA